MQPLEVIEQEHISITDVVKAIRKDSDSQDPVLREVELDAMLRLCELLSQTGVIRIPAIILGGIMAERDRVSMLIDLPQKAVISGLCKACGRDYTGCKPPVEDGKCPSDDCPSNGI